MWLNYDVIVLICSEKEAKYVEWQNRFRAKITILSMIDSYTTLHAAHDKNVQSCVLSSSVILLHERRRQPRASECSMHQLEKFMLIVREQF